MSDHSRRAFIGSAGGCLGATMAACVLRPIDLRALSFTIVDSTHAGQERAFPIPSGDSVAIDRQSSAIVVRLHGRVFACALACPHEQAAVKWVTNAARFQCTKHDSIYTPEGVYHSGRATRNLDRFPIRREGTQVIVRLDQVFRSDLHPDAWNRSDIDVPSSLRRHAALRPAPQGSARGVPGTVDVGVPREWDEPGVRGMRMGPE